MNSWKKAVLIFLIGFLSGMGIMAAILLGRESRLTKEQLPPGETDTSDKGLATQFPIEQSETERDKAKQDETVQEETVQDKTEKEKQAWNFKVVGYFPAWKEDTEKIRYDVLTHINYAFAIPTEDGRLRPLDQAEMAERIISEAHERGVKVFLSVGGWSYEEVLLEPVFVAATETAEKRALLADEIVAMCDAYDFDGVDLDWEHPRVDNNSGYQYEALLKELSEHLHQQGKELSSAVIGGVTADGVVYYDAAAHTEQALEYVDWINVMAYDGGEGERHSAYEFAVACSEYWIGNRHMPPEKVVLGMPFYSRPGWASYEEIMEQSPESADQDHAYYNGLDAWYNGTKTIAAKTQYALEHLGGVMIWEVSQDTSGSDSLQQVIGDTIKGRK